MSRKRISSPSRVRNALLQQLPGSRAAFGLWLLAGLSAAATAGAEQNQLAEASWLLPRCWGSGVTTIPGVPPCPTKACDPCDPPEPGEVNPPECGYTMQDDDLCGRAGGVCTWCDAVAIQYLRFITPDGSGEYLGFDVKDMSPVEIKGSTGYRFAVEAPGATEVVWWVEGQEPHPAGARNTPVSKEGSPHCIGYFVDTQDDIHFGGRHATDREAPVKTRESDRYHSRNGGRPFSPFQQGEPRHDIEFVPIAPGRAVIWCMAFSGNHYRKAYTHIEVVEVNWNAHGTVAADFPELLLRPRTDPERPARGHVRHLFVGEGGTATVDCVLRFENSITDKSSMDLDFYLYTTGDGQAAISATSRGDLSGFSDQAGRSFQTQIHFPLREPLEAPYHEPQEYEHKIVLEGIKACSRPGSVFLGLQINRKLSFGTEDGTYQLPRGTFLNDLSLESEDKATGPEHRPPRNRRLDTEDLDLDGSGVGPTPTEREEDVPAALYREDQSGRGLRTWLDQEDVDQSGGNHADGGDLEGVEAGVLGVTVIRAEMVTRRLGGAVIPYWQRDEERMFVSTAGRTRLEVVLHPPRSALRAHDVGTDRLFVAFRTEPAGDRPPARLILSTDPEGSVPVAVDEKFEVAARPYEEVATVYGRYDLATGTGGVLLEPEVGLLDGLDRILTVSSPKANRDDRSWGYPERGLPELNGEVVRLEPARIDIRQSEQILGNEMPGTPRYLFASAKYATPIRFELPDVTSAYIERIDCIFRIGGREIKRIPLGDRFVAGVGPAQENGTSNSYTCFVPASAFANVVIDEDLPETHVTTEASFQVEVTYGKAAIDPEFLVGASDEHDVDASPRSFYDHRVPGLDAGARDTPNFVAFAADDWPAGSIRSDGTKAFLHFMTNSLFATHDVPHSVNEGESDDALDSFADTSQEITIDGNGFSLRATLGDVRVASTDRWGDAFANVVGGVVRGGVVFASYPGYRVDPLGSELAMDTSTTNCRIAVTEFLSTAEYSMNTRVRRSQGLGMLEILSVGVKYLRPERWLSTLRHVGVALVEKTVQGIDDTAMPDSAEAYIRPVLAVTTPLDPDNPSIRRWDEPLHARGTAAHASAPFLVESDHVDCTVGDQVAFYVEALVACSAEAVGPRMMAEVTAIAELELTASPSDWNDATIRIHKP